MTTPATDANPTLAPLLPGYDPSGHQKNIALQVGTVTQDSTTGVYYAPLVVSASITANVASNGTTGSAVPASADYIGASDGTNLIGLLVEATAHPNLRVGIYNGANEITTNSTTYTAKFGLDSNLLGTLGTAFSTAGKVDVKGADGDVFVRQATAANLNATATIQTTTGTSIAVGSNAVPILNSAATGYVAAYGSNPAALTSSVDTAFKWGASGTTQVNHIMVQNNSSIVVGWDLDVAATAASPQLSNVAGQNTLFLDVQTTAVHFFGAGTPNLNGASASNIVVRGWL